MTVDEDVKEEIKDEKEYWFKSSEGHRKSATKYLNKYLKAKQRVEELEENLKGSEGARIEQVNRMMKKYEKLRTEMHKMIICSKCNSECQAYKNF